MTTTNARPRLSVSSWSLHRSLGQPPSYGVEAGTAIPIDGHNQGRLSLLELPNHIASFGIHSLEICHFHLPSLERGYLAEFKAATAEAGVELFSLLIDAGDITDPEFGERDAAWIRGWLEVGASLGSRCARVIAGKQPPNVASLTLSMERLADLAQAAQALEIRLMTENWFSLLSGPEPVNRLLTGLEGQVGLCLDFGNWSGDGKYAAFEAIAGRAESCHAKAHFSDDGQIDRRDYVRCLEITKAASFSGPYTLIFDSPALDEQAGLTVEKEIVSRFIT